MSFLQLVYASAATTPFTENELLNLLDVSRRNNVELGVTGVLLFMEGSFLQVLEGPPDKVESLYDKIFQDRRHGAVLLLLRREVEDRGFGDWSMGYVNAGKKKKELQGLFDLLGAYKKFSDLQGDQERVRSILNGFKQGKWRRSIQ